MAWSATETQIGVLFHDACVALPLWHLLSYIGHPQPSALITKRSSTVHHFVYDNIHKKRSKSWDMRFYWLRYCANQKQFVVKWASGKTNLADYYTKHHTIPHHKKMRTLYNLDGDFQTPNPWPTVFTSWVRGCVDQHLPPWGYVFIFHSWVTCYQGIFHSL